MIDQRLFPLLETLAASGLDWLVRDILAVVGEGAPQMESEEAMSAAQTRIRLNDDSQSKDEAYLAPSGTRPWSRDEQIEIAANILMTRIDQSLVMARSSIDVILTLTESEKIPNTQQQVEQLVLAGDADEPETVDIVAIDRALEAMTELRFAVEEWRSETLRRGASI